MSSMERLDFDYAVNSERTHVQMFINILPKDRTVLGMVDGGDYAFQSNQQEETLTSVVFRGEALIKPEWFILQFAIHVCRLNLSWDKSPRSE